MKRRLVLSSVALVLAVLPRWCLGIKSIPGVITERVTRDKVVALTFDDGPHPVFTPEVLRLLDRYHVKATFFVVGSQARRYPEIVRSMAVKGHVIGNHTYSHPRNLELTTAAQIEREIDACNAVVESLTGKRPNLFRPPHGLINYQILGLARNRGCRTVLWSVCADNHTAPTPRMMADRVLRAVSPGCIILVHDGGTGIRWKDVQATRIIVESLIKNGYRFVTVTDLLRNPEGSSRSTLHARSQVAQDKTVVHNTH